MTASLYDLNTKTAIDKHNNLTIFVATLIGAAVGVVSTVGLAGSTLGGGTSSGGLRSISARPTSDFSSLCVAPSEAGGLGGGVPMGGAGAVQAAPAIVNAPAGGMGAGEEQQPQGPNVTVIKKIIGSTRNTTAVSLENTGPYSNNEVTTVNKTKTVVKNTNDVSVSNTNTQNATSGDAKVIGNTNGGSADSGDAQNDNSTSTNVNITN